MVILLESIEQSPKRRPAEVLTANPPFDRFAATTPKHWKLGFWDENPLDWRPAFAPMPEVVGITGGFGDQLHITWLVTSSVVLKNRFLHREVASAAGKNMLGCLSCCARNLYLWLQISGGSTAD
jgi:hypothetical protein